jgi:hypothetical protein
VSQLSNFWAELRVIWDLLDDVVKEIDKALKTLTTEVKAAA